MPTDFRFQPKGFRSNLGWYSRGYIPHFEAGERSQFFTFRLFDSLPRAVVEHWQAPITAGLKADRLYLRRGRRMQAGRLRSSRLVLCCGIFTPRAHVGALNSGRHVSS